MGFSDLVPSLLHPSEIVSAVIFLNKKLPPYPEDANKRYCYEILATVSRSFAAVIQELPDELKDPVRMDTIYLKWRNKNPRILAPIKLVQHNQIGFFRGRKP